jgi:hypothetical protein
VKTFRYGGYSREFRISSSLVVSMTYDGSVDDFESDRSKHFSI